MLKYEFKHVVTQFLGGLHAAVHKQKHRAHPADLWDFANVYWSFDQ